MVNNSAIRNFGGNLCFTPRGLFVPTTEAEVLEILDRHAKGKVRVVGALHSWSPLVVCEDALMICTLTAWKSSRGNDVCAVRATVGGGCRIMDMLRKLHSLSDATIPTLGLDHRATIAGAIRTGTHGLGKQSLSHYMEERAWQPTMQGRAGLEYTPGARETSCVPPGAPWAVWELFSLSVFAASRDTMWRRR